MFKNAPVTEASMTGLRMLPEHAEKLMLQEPSPLKKYAQPHNGMLSALVDNEYTRRHRQQVHQQDGRVAQLVDS